jgi:hypothetical protein
MLSFTNDMTHKNGVSPITLPVVTDDPRHIGRFSRDVRKAIAALRDRKPIVRKSSSPEYSHPFRIIAEYDSASNELRGYVCSGRCTRLTMVTSGAEYPTYVECDCRFGDSTALRDDDFSSFSTIGYEVLAAGQTYGVWLKTYFDNVPTSYPNNMPTYSGQQFDNILMARPMGVAKIKFSTSDPDPTDGASAGNGEGDISGSGFDAQCFYLGQVIVNSEGTGAEIKQYRKSDIVIQGIVFSQGFRIVSTDLNNNILEGSDGGAYYNDPDY